MSERCENCGQTLATQEEWDAHPQGCECDLCVSLCWSSFGGDCPADDLYWRTRCLAAEAERDDFAQREWQHVEAYSATADALRAAGVDLDDTDDATTVARRIAGLAAERDGLRARLDAAVRQGKSYLIPDGVASLYDLGGHRAALEILAALKGE